MKPISILLVAATSLVSVVAVASPPNRPMSGAYQVQTGDCFPSLLLTGDKVAVDSTQTALRITKGEEVIQLNVGVSHEFCMGDCESYYSTSYSQDGTVISQIRLMANAVGALPVFAGAIIAKYAHGQLSISNNDNGQFTAGETKTCTLKSL